MIRFAQSYFLYFLAAIPLVVLFYIYVFKAKKKALRKFGNPLLIQKLTLSISRKRQVIKSCFLIAALLFLIVAASGPQLGTKLEEVNREGIDIIVALDVSLSMKAEDIKPNRLAKAKREISNLINKLQGDRIGLIAFAGISFVQCPLTLDYGAAKLFLDAIDTELIPQLGTAIASAVEEAIVTFNQQERKHKVLIIMTDGEDHEEKVMEAAKKASEEGIIIYAIGIGSKDGVPIPIYDKYGNRTGFKKDRQGNVVTTKIDELTLERITLETGGKYYRASRSENELDKLYGEITKMEKKEIGAKQISQYEERYQYLLAFVLILIVLEVLIPERHKVVQEWQGRFE